MAIKRRPFPRFITVAPLDPFGWVAEIRVGFVFIRIAASTRWLAIEASLCILDRIADAHRREWGMR